FMARTPDASQATAMLQAQIGHVLARDALTRALDDTFRDGSG
ncbi:MAG: hypothetical protein K0R83_1202, partial [Caulobacter sp.]|nr:hypothetical protein [Caulobacter sp.]